MGSSRKRAKTPGGAHRPASLGPDPMIMMKEKIDLNVSTATRECTRLVHDGTCCPRVTPSLRPASADQAAGFLPVTTEHHATDGDARFSQWLPDAEIEQAEAWLGAVNRLAAEFDGDWERAMLVATSLERRVRA
jgi:hypothetical protein